MVPTVDIVIVNWNAGEYLRECIKSVRNTQNNNFQLSKIIIVDNNSSDDSIHLLNEINDLPLLIIRNQENVGFGKACNYGVKAGNGEYLLILNPDTILYSDSISSPLEFFLKKENEKIGMLGIKLINDDNRISRNCARFPTPFKIIYYSFGLDKIFPKIFTPHFMLEWDHNQNKQVDQIMGSYILMKRKLFEELNGYDDDYFVYYEDLDLTLRAKNKGFSNFYFAGASMYHKGGGTSEQIKATRLYYNIQGKLIYCKKHFTRFQYIIVSIFILFIEPFSRIIQAILKGSLSIIKEILIGYSKIYRFYFNIK